MFPYWKTEPTEADVAVTAEVFGNTADLLKAIVGWTRHMKYPPTEHLRVIRELALAAQLLEAEPIVISISGADYSAHSAHGYERSLIVIDYEGTQNYDDTAVTLVPQKDGDTSRAIVYSMGVGKLDPVIAEFARAYDAGEDLKED